MPRTSAVSFTFPSFRFSVDAMTVFSTSASGRCVGTVQPSADSDTGRRNAKSSSVIPDFVARRLAHVPEPRRHFVHDYGARSNVVRSKLRKRVQAETQATEPFAEVPVFPRLS